MRWKWGREGEGEGRREPAPLVGMAVGEWVELVWQVEGGPEVHCAGSPAAQPGWNQPQQQYC